MMQLPLTGAAAVAELPTARPAASAARRSRLALVWPALGGVCALIAFALRFYAIGRQSLWLDEGAAYAIASLPLPKLVGATFSTEPNPPLYYLLLHGWMATAGDGELALRALSAVFGVALVALVYRLAADLASPPAAAGAAWLAAFSPYLIYYAQEARMYALLACLATAAALALWRALRRPAGLAWLRFGLLLLSTLYTHFYGSFVALGLALTALVWLRDPKARAAWRPALLAFALPAALYLPWLVANLRAGAARASWRVPLDAPTILQTSLAAYAHGGFLTGPLGGWLAAAYALAALAGLTAVWRRGHGGGRGALLLAGALGVPLLAAALLAQRQPIYSDRYVIAQAPLLLVAAAAGLTPPWRKLAPLAVPALTALAALSLVAIATAWNAPQYRKEDFRDAAAYLRQRATAADAIVVVAGYASQPLTYYYRGPASVLPFTGDVQHPEAALAAPLANKQTVWLLLSHAEQDDPQGRVQRWLATQYPEETEAFVQGVRIYAYRAAFRVSALPAGAVQLHRRFGAALELVGYQADSGLPPTDTLYHPPSNWLHVTLYWRATGHVPAGAYRPSVQVVDARGVWGEALERAGNLFALAPPAAWPPGQLMAEDEDVNLNPRMPPGRYALQVQLRGPDDKPLPAPGDPTIGEVTITGGR